MGAGPDTLTDEIYSPPSPNPTPSSSKTFVFIESLFPAFPKADYRLKQHTGQRWNTLDRADPY